MKNKLSPEVNGFIVSATHSGAGKSSIAFGLMRLLNRKGYKIAPFKVGPDYIDPSHHERACSHPSYNLDSQMCSSAYVRKLFLEKSQEADISIAEGVMGLFDGASVKNEKGSTAQISKLTGLPILFVFDGSAMARSSAALIKGFKEFDSEVEFLGVIANRVNSERHANMIRQAVASVSDIPFIGHLPYVPELEISSRHLGLQLGAELTNQIYERWADHVEKHLDIKKIISLVYQKQTKRNESPNLSPRWKKSRSGKAFSVAIAKDSAFQFVYQDTLDQFRFFGGEVKFFSPVNEKAIPYGVDWIYLPGGYPEMHAEQLSKNSDMRKSILQWGQSGKPMVAECGGLMYLGKSITDEDGKKFKMVGLYSFDTSLNPKRMTLGYRDLKFAENGETALRLKGHEFHYSHFNSNKQIPQLSSTGKNESSSIKDGYIYKNTFASYSHIYWGSNPKWLDFILSKIK